MKRTKANKAAHDTYRDARRRAMRKLNRLQKKGVNTNALKVIKKVDTTDTWALKREAKRLEKFIDRRSQWEPGQDGTPIPRAEIKALRKAEKKFNEAHSKFWQQHGGEEVVSGGVHKGLTLEDYRSLTVDKYTKMNNPYYQSNIDVSRLTRSEVKRRTKTLEREASGEYQIKRTRQLRKNLVDSSSYFGDTKLTNQIKYLTNKQLNALSKYSTFLEKFFLYYRGDNITATDPGGELLNIIEEIKLKHPRR